MEPATKFGIVVAFAGIGISLLNILLAEDLKAMAKWVRVTLAFGGMIMLVVGAAIVAFWPTPVPGLGPKLEVFKVEWIDHPLRSKALKAFNFHFKNVGDRPALALVERGIIGIANGTLSRSAEDDSFQKLMKGRSPDPNGTSEVDAGDANNWNTLFDDTVTDALLAMRQAQSLPYYTMIVIKYIDPATGDVVVTEYCSFDVDGVGHLCIGHNRIWKIKKAEKWWKL